MPLPASVTEHRCVVGKQRWPGDIGATHFDPRNQVFLAQSTDILHAHWANNHLATGIHEGGQDLLQRFPVCMLMLGDVLVSNSDYIDIEKDPYRDVLLSEVLRSETNGHRGPVDIITAQVYEQLFPVLGCAKVCRENGT